MRLTTYFALNNTYYAMPVHLNRTLLGAPRLASCRAASSAVVRQTPPGLIGCDSGDGVNLGDGVMKLPNAFCMGFPNRKGVQIRRVFSLLGRRWSSARAHEATAASVSSNRKSLSGPRITNPDASGIQSM